MDLIKSVAWLHVEQGNVLCVRTRGKDKFYIPGGKIDPGERPEAALMREIKEELNVALDAASITPAVEIIAQAHGFDGEKQVAMQCFFADHQGAIAASSEIEAILWVGPDEIHHCAPAAQQAIAFIASR